MFFTTPLTEMLKEFFIIPCQQVGIDGIILPDLPFEEKDEFQPICRKYGVDLKAIVDVVRQNTDIPCAIGFGISTPEQAKKMADISEGAIVGSAIIKLLEQHGKTHRNISANM